MIKPQANAAKFTRSALNHLLRRSLVLALTLALLMATNPSFAENKRLQAALTAYEQGDIQTAIAKLEQLAEDGLPEAKYYLSNFYEQGIGVTQQPESAFALCSDAAKQGLAMAQTRVAWFYQLGIGTKADIEQALIWYQRAANQGEENALLQLGFLYTGKAGVGRDFDKARAYFVAAAELGNIKAAHNAGIMYQLAIQPAGRKSPRWSATKAALKWFTVAADKGYASSQFELGNMYALGQGLPVSYEQAVFWYTLAQSNGHEEAGNRRFAVELNLDAAHRARIAQQLQKWRKEHL